MVTTVPSSRAGSLALVGGELALDFANTSSGRGSPNHHDHLQLPLHVAQWAGHARILVAEDADWLAEAAVVDASLGARLLREALILREDIYELCAALAAGFPAPPGRLESLTTAHARALARSRLTPIGGNFDWAWSPHEAPLASVVGPISLSALKLLQHADLARMKQCQGNDCGWLFFDTTKNRSRRWCEMKVCGNRAKQKRFGAKARE